MKKSLLALAVAAIATSASAATVYDKDGTSMDVYGRVQSVVYSTHATPVKSADSTLQTSGRLGLNLRQQVTPGFAVIANAEWDVEDAYRDGFSVRYMWVGADMGQFGTVKAGRFEDAVKYVLNTTDIFDDWGCVGQAGNDDKRDGMFGYTWSGYGFDFNVTAQMASDGQQVDSAYHYDALNNKWLESQNINDGYAVSVGYTSAPVVFGPIAVRLGYGHVDFQDDAGVKGTLDNYDQYAAALSWGSLSEGLYVAALYNMRSFEAFGANHDYDVEGIEAVVGYSFANGITVRTGYNYKNLDEDSVGDVTSMTVPVYVNYQVSPAFNVWAEARFDAGSDDATDVAKLTAAKVANNAEMEGYAENVYSVGARYTF